MKKILAIVMALAMVFAAATVLAEENTFTFRNGVTFGLNMDQVMDTETGMYEIENEHTRGLVTFDELEYEQLGSTAYDFLDVNTPPDVVTINTD